MATLTVKNIPDELYEKLKRSAARHRRSINSEAIVCLERVLGSRPIDPAAFLVQVRDLRATLEGIHVVDPELEKAIEAGRP